MSTSGMHAQAMDRADELLAEDLLLRHLLARLGKLSALPPHQVIGTLPRRLPISPEFVSRFESLARGLLLRGLARAFGFGTLYLLRDDSTLALRGSDPELWLSLRPRLSRAAIDWLWWDYRAGALPETAPTPWDALLLELLIPDRERPRLVATDLLAGEDWPVLAWLLLGSRPDMAMLGPLWARSQDLAYPLRFLLIARSAAWFAAQNLYWNARLREASFGLSEYQELRRLAAGAGLDTIPKRVQAWQSSQQLGYDDALWIGRDLARSRLLPELHAFAALVTSLGELGDGPASSPERTSP